MKALIKQADSETYFDPQILREGDWFYYEGKVCLATDEASYVTISDDGNATICGIKGIAHKVQMLDVTIVFKFLDHHLKE